MLGLHLIAGYFYLGQVVCRRCELLIPEFRHGLTAYIVGKHKCGKNLAKNCIGRFQSTPKKDR
jgi:hypothetical protein